MTDSVRMCRHSPTYEASPDVHTARHAACYATSGSRSAIVALDIAAIIQH